MYWRSLRDGVVGETVGFPTREGVIGGTVGSHIRDGVVGETVGFPTRFPYSLQEMNKYQHNKRTYRYFLITKLAVFFCFECCIKNRGSCHTNKSYYNNK